MMNERELQVVRNLFLTAEHIANQLQNVQMKSAFLFDQEYPLPEGVQDLRNALDEAHTLFGSKVSS